MTASSPGGIAGTISDGGVPSGSGGALSLVKTGSGMLNLAGSNGYTGGTTIAAGRLIILGDSSLGGIFCSHVIEHLHPPEALRLIRESYRVLKSGGTLVLVTPNPQNLLVLTEVFWLDLTHVRFYPVRLLNRVLEEVGFTFVKCFEDKHTRYGTPYRAVAGFLRRVWFWGLANRGDVVAVGRK